MSALLRSDARPLRALRALARSTPSDPRTEDRVYNVAGSFGGSYHNALASLVAAGLAQRCSPDGDGRATWAITAAGLAELREHEEGSS